MRRARSKKFLTFILAVMMVLSLMPASESFAANQQFIVDIAATTGSLMYGGIGGLYALGDEGVPTDNILAPLKTRIINQKPPNGLQHPNGDALKVAPQFFRNGGQEIQMNIQDMYQNWPYDNNGLSDYLTKVDAAVASVKADPYWSSGKYSYVIFNEPNLQWYVNNVTGMCNDWLTVYNRIRITDGDTVSKIAGPNFSGYDDAAYTTFMTFCKNNNCLPDEVTWHELGNTFYTGWDSHISAYRAIERNLGISERRVVINEYLLAANDEGCPGKMVQFISKFEHSNVYGCIAYWTSAGAYCDNVTQNNKATGGWWLFKWYSDMTGNECTVTPSNWNAQGLQGIASVDSTKKQARVIFGGTGSNSDMVIKGFGSQGFFGSSVHVTVLGINYEGRTSAGDNYPSAGPYFKQEGDYTVSNDQITVTVNSMNADSAYLMIVTPNTDLTAANISGRYEAEYAKVSGSAKVLYGTNTGYSGTYYVEGYGASSNASTEFDVTAPNDGYYNVTLRYSAGPYTGAPTDRTIRCVLNGSTLTDISLPGTADWSTWNSVTTNMFLRAGINRIAFNAFTNDDSDAINIDYIDVAAASGTITSYEAEASGNTLGGAAVVQSNANASGGQDVEDIGNGSANYLTFNNVNVATAGTYRMIIQYANGELGSGASNYNSNVVDRYADVSVNGGASQKVMFRNTFGWSTWRTTVCDVTLNAGNNTIKFSNSSSGYCANIDKISIAAPIAPPSAPLTGIISGQTYTLKSVYSGLKLDNYNSTSNGNYVGQWAANGNTTQNWTITYVGGGYYTLVNQMSARALDNGNVTTNGAHVMQWSPNGGNTQLWKIVNVSGNVYTLQNQMSGLNLDNGSSTSNGQTVIQYTPNSNTSQQWIIQ